MEHVAQALGGDRLGQHVVYPVPLKLLQRRALVSRARDENRLLVNRAARLCRAEKGSGAAALAGDVVALEEHLRVAPAHVQTADARQVDVHECELRVGRAVGRGYKPRR